MTLRRLRPIDGLKTYRYLRLGIIASVLLLGISLIIEVKRVSGCLLGSISAYYYSPVRPVFVGVMFVIGASLIAYKGRTRGEDVRLNIAGMLAPLVAVAPTWEDVSHGLCQPFVSQSPFALGPDPDAIRTPAAWVTTAINNNVTSLLWVGAVGVAFALIVWRWNLSHFAEHATDHPQWTDQDEPGTGLTLLWTGGALATIAGLRALEPKWFLDSVHGWAAIALFAFLWLAILANVVGHRRDSGLWNERNGLMWWGYFRNVFAPRGPTEAWERRYRRLALLMALGMAIPISKVLLDKLVREGYFWNFHHTFWLEAWEICIFAAYWIVQTIENWFEDVQPSE
jgi:hypothetical protein